MINIADLRNLLTRAVPVLGDFHAVPGGGGRKNAPPPCISAPMGRIEMIKKRSKARQKSFRKYFGQFFAKVKMRLPEVKKGQFLPFSYMHPQTPIYLGNYDS